MYKAPKDTTRHSSAELDRATSRHAHPLATFHTTAISREIPETLAGESSARSLRPHRIPFPRFGTPGFRGLRRVDRTSSMPSSPVASLLRATGLSVKRAASQTHAHDPQPPVRGESRSELVRSPLCGCLLVYSCVLPGHHLTSTWANRRQDRNLPADHCPSVEIIQETLFRIESVVVSTRFELLSHYYFRLGGG